MIRLKRRQWKILCILSENINTELLQKVLLELIAKTDFPSTWTRPLDKISQQTKESRRCDFCDENEFSDNQDICMISTTDEQWSWEIGNVPDGYDDSNEWMYYPIQYKWISTNPMNPIMDPIVEPLCPVDFICFYTWNNLGEQLRECLSIIQFRIQECICNWSWFLILWSFTITLLK